MVPMKDIRAFARRIAKEFRPQRIILFGSHAYGKPNTSSDVDLLIEMPYRGHPTHKAAEILVHLNPTFAVDLIVRSPAEIKRRIAMNDWFLQDVVTKGVVLYECRNGRVGHKSRRRLRVA